MTQKKGRCPQGLGLYSCACTGTDVFCLSRRVSSDRLQKLYKIRPRTPTSKNGVSPRQNAKNPLAHRHQHARSELHKLQNSRHLVSTDRKSKRQSRTASPRPGAKIHPAEPASDSTAPGGPPGPIKNAPSGTAGERMDTASYTACVSYTAQPTGSG